MLKQQPTEKRSYVWAWYITWEEKPSYMIVCVRKTSDYGSPQGIWQGLGMPSIWFPDAVPVNPHLVLIKPQQERPHSSRPGVNQACPVFLVVAGNQLMQSSAEKQNWIIGRFSTKPSSRFQNLSRFNWFFVNYRLIIMRWVRNHVTEYFIEWTMLWISLAIGKKATIWYNITMHTCQPWMHVTTLYVDFLSINRAEELVWTMYHK